MKFSNPIGITPIILALALFAGCGQRGEDKKAAATQVRTDLDAAVSAVSSELKPSVDQVKTAFDGLETTLAGLSSAGGLGEAATAIGTSLTELGTALNGLTTEIGQVC